MSFKHLYAVRYMSWIAVIASLIGSLLMFLIGGYKTIIAVGEFLGFSTIISPNEPLSQHISPGNLAMASMVSAVDVFLFALILLIFAFGVYHLFIADHEKHKDFPLPAWARINSVTELKTTLAQVIIIILFVDFLESAVSAGLQWVPWEALVSPIAILLLAGALRLIHTSET